MRFSVLADSPEDLCEPLSMVQAVLRDSPLASYGHAVVLSVGRPHPARPAAQYPEAPAGR
jgi:hypothetical protein